MNWRFQKRDIYNGDQKVNFRGVAVGNWMLLEAYMHGLPGQASQVRRVLSEELGADRASEYWRVYEDHFFTERDVVHLKSLGCNGLRIPFNQRFFEAEANPGVYRERGFELLDRVFNWAAAHDMWVLLDMHAVIGSQSTDWYADCEDGRARFWERADFRQRAIDLWVVLANRYGGHPRLFGYDLLCEPVQPNSVAINAYYAECIAAIRRVDTTSIIQLEPNHWARDGFAVDAGLLDDPLVMLHGHWYAGQHLPTHEMSTYPQPELGLTDEALLKGMESTLDPMRLVRPGMIGEFGFMHNGRTGSAEAQLVLNQAKVLDANGIHRSLWAAKDVGAISVLYPNRETAWRRFLNRPDIREPLQKLKEITHCAFGANEGFVRSSGGSLQKSCHEIFPELEAEIVPRQVMECDRALSILGLRHAARKMAQLDDYELMDCARSFDFEHCQSHPELEAVLRG